MEEIKEYTSPLDEIKEYINTLGFEEVNENNFQKIMHGQGSVTIINGRRFEQPGPQKKLNILYNGEGYIANVTDGDSDDIRQIIHWFSICEDGDEKIEFGVETLDDFKEYI